MELIRSLIAWVGTHPNAAGVTIGLVAFSESLAFVGLIVPGAMILFAAGALIADGALPFWPMVAWAAAGAILGDGISYLAGHHYRERIRLLWPFAKHPGLLQRGESFFRRHGGKSIVLGRFVGPVRPVVPIVAGMLGMKPLRFYSTNVLSGLAWAPSYLLPGMAFGASLAVAGKVAERLAALLGTLLISVWAIAWLVHALFRFLQPHAEDWARQALRWSRGHRGANWLIGDLIDPSAPASRALLLWVAVLIAGTWLFFGVLQDVVAQDPLLRANEAIYQMLQGLRTPLGDRIMIAFSELGDWPVTTATTVTALAWLAWRRAGRDAAYWLTAIAFAWCSVLSLKLLLHMPRPVAGYSGATTYSFPSGHATMSVVIYGYLSVLGARDLAVRWRWIPYAAATLLIAGISFSRIYLGVHWLSDVLAGLAMGMAGVSVVAIARQRHIRTHPSHGILWVAVGALLVSGIWHAQRALATDLQRYAVQRPIETVSETAWWRDEWQALPAYRIDLGGGEKQPLNVQWGGSLSVLRERLLAAGWQRPMPLRLRTALRWLSPDLPLAELPLLPQLHDGRREALSLILDAGGTANRQLLLRLWPSSYRLEPGAQPVWVGTVAWLRIQRLPFLRLPRTMSDYDDALMRMRSSVAGIRTRTARRLESGRGVSHETLIAVMAGSAGPSRSGD
jgi:undecaprenyl-diphosphatase